MARVLYPAGWVEAGADRSDDSFCGKQSMPHDVPCSSLRRYVGYCQGLWRVRFLCSRQVRCPKIPNRDGRGTNNSSSSVARLAESLQQIDRQAARRALSRRRDEPGTTSKKSLEPWPGQNSSSLRLLSSQNKANKFPTALSALLQRGEPPIRLRRCFSL